MEMEKTQLFLEVPDQKTLGDFQLLDSGDGSKLERYGKFVLSRPDPQALWPKSMKEREWLKADATFSSDGVDGWRMKKTLPKQWDVKVGDLRLWVHLSAFKHTGVFPEQSANWHWLEEKISKSKNVSVLNLFGYTGGATLAAARAGASVCHVDSSKTAVTWARENALLNNLSAKPIRWIVDDALAFAKREVRRGSVYDGIILDPPIFGHGPKGSLWKIEKDLLELLDICTVLLSKNPVFFLLNGYAAGYSSVAYTNNLLGMFKKAHGNIEGGEIGIAEASGERILPCGIYARWSSVK